MKINIRYILFFIVFFGFCSSPDNFNFDDTARQERKPVQEAWNFKISITENDHTLAKVKSGHMEQYEGQDEIELSDELYVDFYNKAGEHTSFLKSKKGTVNDKTKIMKAIGNVVLISDSGFTLYSDELTWDNKNEKIKTDKFVTIITDVQDTLYGYGFESDQGMNNYKIMRPFGVSGKKVELK